jgi:hypothetical protein
MAQRGDEPVNYIPVKNYFVPTPSMEDLVSRGLIGAEDTARVLTGMKFTFPKNSAMKSDLAVLNIIAAIANDGWKRPLYFDAGLRQSDYVGTGEYMRMEGMVYRLMPFRVNDSVRINPSVIGSIDTKKGYNMFMNTFVWGGAEREDVYFDEPNRHELISYRMNGSFLANQLAVEGENAKALQILDKVTKNITEHSYPYGYDYSGYFISAAYFRAGDRKKGAAIADKIVKNAEQTVKWVTSLSDESRFAMTDVVAQQFEILQGIGQAAYSTGDTATANLLLDKMKGILTNPKAKELIESRSRGGQQRAAEEEE